MEIQWHNIAVLGLVILVVVVFVKNKSEIASFLMTAKSIGSGAPEEQVTGLIAVGILGIITVAVLRILINANGKDNE